MGRCTFTRGLSLSEAASFGDREEEEDARSRRFLPVGRAGCRLHPVSPSPASFLVALQRWLHHPQILLLSLAGDKGDGTRPGAFCRVTPFPWVSAQIHEVSIFISSCFSCVNHFFCYGVWAWRGGLHPELQRAQEKLFFLLYNVMSQA